MFGQRALQDLAMQVGGILKRIESLESAPTVTPCTHTESLDVAQLVRERPALEHLLQNITGRLDAVEKDRKELALAIGEGIERVDRNERRIQNTIRRAKRELADIGIIDEGLEAESSALHDGDAEGGEVQGVLPLRKEVGSDPGEASSIRGVSLEQLRKFRGVK